jgi:hypothetical protein
MTGDVLVGERVGTTRATAPVAWLLLTSLVFAALQVSLTDYGQAGGAAFSFGLAVVLLGFVHARRSRSARRILVVLAITGAILHGLGGIGADDYPLLLVLAWVGQAVPLLTRPVREHVHAS